MYLPWASGVLSIAARGQNASAPCRYSMMGMHGLLYENGSSRNVRGNRWSNATSVALSAAATFAVNTAPEPAAVGAARAARVLGLLDDA